MANKAKHAYGSLKGVDAALEAGTIDAYDVLFLKDENNKAHIGWIDKNGKKNIVEGKKQIVRVESLPTEDGEEDVVYIYNDEGYIWNGTQCVSISKSADVSALETEIATKVTAEEVKTMIKESEDSFVEIVEF